MVTCGEVWYVTAGEKKGGEERKEEDEGNGKKLENKDKENEKETKK